MITALFVICGAGILLLLIFAFKGPTKLEKEEKERLQKSLEDDRIFDPETGVYISLEEAESGVWSTDDREKHYVSELQLSKEGDDIKDVLDYLNTQQTYKALGQLPDVEYDIVEGSKILSKYDDWSYSDAFLFKNGIVFLVRSEESYYSSQLMCLLGIESLKGHYYLREKDTAEKVLDFFRKDDDLSLENYESFTIKRSENIDAINSFLKIFEGETGLELEINDTFLFIKTLGFAKMEDLKRIEKIIQKMDG
jgi:hypothetical protein